MRIFTAKSMAWMVLLLLAAPALAQSLDQHRANCSSSDPETGDLKITGCTAVIESGQLTRENLATAFNFRGNAYKAKQNLTRAINDFSQAIRLDPQYADAYYNRGEAKRLLGKTAEGNADRARARALIPRRRP